jgi:hypothetical protein
VAACCHGDTPDKTDNELPNGRARLNNKLRPAIRAQRLCDSLDQPEPAEINAIRLAWEDVEDLAA